MIRKILRVIPVAALLCLSLTGCQRRYIANRVADFGDIFQFGAGLTTENPATGVIPPSLGVYVQVTEFLNLGALHFDGHSAEWDGRGLFCGPESRTRIGILTYQRLRIDQHYSEGSENYFKKLETLWSDRMNSPRMSWGDKPAKQLNYEYWGISTRDGAPIMHRGYQYWENIGAEICISEPFLTHFGFNLRLGFDPSEISDWVLGWFCVDYKRDDLTEDEHREMVGERDVTTDFKPASD